MTGLLDLKTVFYKNKEQLFKNISLNRNAFAFSVKYSILVEEFVRSIAGNKKFSFALASSGSFCRRELSPYSDIDLVFIVKTFDEKNDDIQQLVTLFWDNGLEVSHTIREYSDIEKFRGEDLHTFTQFFETRFLLGSEKIYKEWNQLLLENISREDKADLINEFFSDINSRHHKYGDSPKVLEPNVKMSAGGLRDFQSIEWIYIFKYNTLLHEQTEMTQAEAFVRILEEKKFTTPDECKRLLNSYRLILGIRNLLHIINRHKVDRLEFNAQTKISKILSHHHNSLALFMKDYFEATNTIYRFTHSMIIKFRDEISNPLPDTLAIELDDDFILKRKTISVKVKNILSLSEILRGFYYRAFHGAFFDEPLRSLIIESVRQYELNPALESESSVFFREILKLPKYVGETLSVMNELGVLGTFLPEFGDLVGFLQHGVYHCYTADEHTLFTIKNLELLEKEKSPLGDLYGSIKQRELIFLGLLFHDIAKPINIAGHEIIGAEIAESVMTRLGYSEEEIERVCSLVKNHLIMEQIAFRRNLNDPETLNNFVSKFNSVEELDMLYLVTYADLSAVNPAVWTSWKSDLLFELYSKTRAMLEKEISAEDLLYSVQSLEPLEISKHSESLSESEVLDHIDSMQDITYTQQFSEEEIARHIEEIQKGELISVLFKETNGFTNITIITKDSPSLLSKLCGVLSINDANIHDARIFTRKDGIVIDTFNVTDFRTHSKLDSERYIKIERDFYAAITGMIQLNQEFKNMKSKWWRIENKFFKRTGKVKVVFEEHEKFTIIDIFSPDRLGFLFEITKKFHELGLNIYLAKISTKADDIVDTFYTLTDKGKKISPNDYELIRQELTSTINEML